ncbi:PD-(D/E)XK nuclease family protein [Candidatus Woesearchaeota archaeon]|nr:PD-(D/E)XK nuclease family protein [Candidatus Woesearchaeota archaeon]
MILKKSFNHGWFYVYRLHKDKIDQLCLDELNNYLVDVFCNCDDEKFCSGPRSSALRFDLGIETKEIFNHEICSLTSKGLEENFERFKTAHSQVQVYMLENDDKTIGVEVPVWFEKDEMNTFKNIFGECDGVLSGHIDVLRIEDGKIWVLDYKPNAYKEKYAATQVYFYALMLSARTGIPLDKFRCGYFDSSKCYVFKI